MKFSRSIEYSNHTIYLKFVYFTCLFVLLILPAFAQTPELTLDKVLINNMGAPWGFTFVNSDEVLFTEKQGKIFRYIISTNTLTEIKGLPTIAQNGQGGLLDIALHPDFANNSYVYITYAVAGTGGQTTAMGRGKLIGNELQNFTELFRALPLVNSGAHFGSRLAFDKNNFLFMSVGERGSQDNAQNTNNHLGKILRFNDDGTVPTNNPLVGVPNTKPEIYSWGHRNIQGMAMHPETGEIYAHEHGPRGGDELNLVKPNTNYGWPKVTFGINYDGSPITPDTTLPGMELPLTYWVPSIAPSGLAFIKNGQPKNEFDVILGALAGTHIHWLKLRDNKVVLSSRSLNGYARFRDVRQAPDGKIYAMTESPNRFISLQTNIPIINPLEKNLSVSTNTLSLPNSANSSASFNIISNTSWTITNLPSWLQLNPTNGSGTMTVSVIAESNTSANTRKAVLIVSGLNVSSQTISVLQEGKIMADSIDVEAVAILSPFNFDTVFVNREYPLTYVIRNNSKIIVRNVKTSVDVYDCPTTPRKTSFTLVLDSIGVGNESSRTISTTTITFPRNGQYKAVLSVNSELDSNPNNDSLKTNCIFAFDITSIQSQDESNLVIYPNPSNGEFTVSSDEPIENIRITDKLGRIVFESNYYSKEINLKELQSGIYFVTTTYAGISKTSKLIINAE